MIRLLIFVFTIGSIFCYETGHHNDLTRNGLQMFNYSQYPMKIVPLCNWFTDYFAYTYLKGEKLVELNTIHFDNLYSLKDATLYWNQLVVNTRNGARQAAQANDPLRFLVYLGSSVHAVQDFYTHSNWVYFFPQPVCDCFNVTTWFNVVHSVNGSITDMLSILQGLHTYSWGSVEDNNNVIPGTVPHGGYCEGLNKDSYVRPFWEQSYAHAFAATVEWIYNVESWAREVSPNFIQSVRNYVPPTSEDIEDLNDNYLSAYRISYSTDAGVSNNGHWKGPGSGSKKRFAQEIGDFITTSSIYKDIYTKDKAHLLLTNPNLYEAPDSITNPNASLQYVTPFVNMPTELSEYTAVKVRTTEVSLPDSINTPSPYAKVIIDGMEFIEAVQIDSTKFRPHWTSLKFVPASVTQVSIQYTLWKDEWPDDDDVIRIISGKDSLNFVLNTADNSLSGDIVGMYNSTNNVFTTSNDDNQVSFFVKTSKYGNCSDTDPYPEYFCEDEAYTELKLHKWCLKDKDDEQKLEGSASSLVYSLAIILVALFTFLY